MRAVLLLIVGVSIITVGAASEWEEPNVTLKWGENVSFYNYNITALDFSPGTVEEHPEICDNETMYNQLTIHERTIYGCNDYVFLNVSKYGSHVMDALLSKRNITIDGAEFTNETTYEDDEGSLKIHVLDISLGYYLITPSVNLDIIVDQNESADLDIVNNLTIYKIVPEEAHVNPCNQFIPVTISAENIGKLNLSYIKVVDDVGDGFVSEPQDLNWSISLSSGKMWQTQYLIKPLDPVAGAEYSLPPAMLYVAYYNKIYNLSTGNISFILRSSDINLSKTAGNENESNFTVNLSVENNGSRAASVKVWDSLLPGMEIVSGNMNFSTVLQPGSSYNQSYIFKLNNVSGNISLPTANFTFREYRPCFDPKTNSQAITGSGISNRVQINSGIILSETADKKGAGTLENNGSGAELAKPAPTDVRIASNQNLPTSFEEKPKNTDTPGSNESIIIPAGLKIGSLEIIGIMIISITITLTARRIFPR